MIAKPYKPSRGESHRVSGALAVFSGTQVNSRLLGAAYVADNKNTLLPVREISSHIAHGHKRSEIGSDHL